MPTKEGASDSAGDSLPRRSDALDPQQLWASLRRNYRWILLCGALVFTTNEPSPLECSSKNFIYALDEMQGVQQPDKYFDTVTGQAGFVSDNIAYLDVGLKLEVEPSVYADDEVGIRVALEVSSLGTPVRTAAGALAYQIGTRNASTYLRLRDGETQLLAGLISRDERTSANRLPGLGDLPAVGRLFSSTADNASRTELVLAVTPRILRNVQRPTATEAELWIGTEARPGLRNPRLPKAAEPAGAPVVAGAAPERRRRR